MQFSSRFFPADTEGQQDRIEAQIPGDDRPHADGQQGVYRHRPRRVMADVAPGFSVNEVFDIAECRHKIGREVPK